MQQDVIGDDAIRRRVEDLPPDRAGEAHRLDAIFRAATGWQPRLWGRIVGYGAYDYRYDSGRSGTFLATGFSPGPREHSVHILPGYAEFPEIAARLGPHRRGKSCWYVRRLGAIDEDALADLIRAGLDDLARHWTVRGS